MRAQGIGLPAPLGNSADTRGVQRSTSRVATSVTRETLDAVISAGGMIKCGGALRRFRKPPGPRRLSRRRAWSAKVDNDTEAKRNDNGEVEMTEAAGCPKKSNRPQMERAILR